MFLECVPSPCPVLWVWLLGGERFGLSRRTVKIYDNRSLKSKSGPVSELQGHSLRVGSAYFSPSTGNRVLTSCGDDRIR